MNDERNIDETVELGSVSIETLGFVAGKPEDIGLQPIGINADD